MLMPAGLWHCAGKLPADLHHSNMQLCRRMRRTPVRTLKLAAAAAALKAAATSGPTAAASPRQW